MSALAADNHEGSDTDTDEVDDDDAPPPLKATQRVYAKGDVEDDDEHMYRAPRQERKAALRAAKAAKRKQYGLTGWLAAQNLQARRAAETKRMAETDQNGTATHAH